MADDFIALAADLVGGNLDAQGGDTLGLLFDNNVHDGAGAPFRPPGAGS
jgi:hypothetical protein